MIVRTGYILMKKVNGLSYCELKICFDPYFPQECSNLDMLNLLHFVNWLLSATFPYDLFRNHSSDEIS